MDVKSLKYRHAQHTHTHTHTHTHAQKTWKVRMRRTGGTGCLWNYPLEDATQMSVGETATLPLCTSMWAILGQITLLPPGQVQGGPPLILPPRTKACDYEWELMKTQDSEGREISNNQKPRLHNVHLYHNILTVLLPLHTAWQHLCSMCLS